MRLVDRWADEGMPRGLFRHPALLLALATVLCTAALCSYDRFCTRTLSAGDARLSIANGSATKAAVVVLLRDIRADVELLDQLAQQSGELADQARAALGVVRECVSK